MRLKNRMKKLEQVHGGIEPSIIQFRTDFEDKDGNVNDEGTTVLALVDWGSGRCTAVSRTDSESIAEFEARIDRISQLSWEEANDQSAVQKWGG